MLPMIFGIALSDFLWLADSPDWVGGAESGENLLLRQVGAELLRGEGKDRRADRAGRDGIDPDAHVGMVERHGAGQGVDRPLARHVRGDALLAAAAGYGLRRFPQVSPIAFSHAVGY